MLQNRTLLQGSRINDGQLKEDIAASWLVPRFPTITEVELGTFILSNEAEVNDQSNKTLLAN
jgi:hypothetical protein